ncbi:pilus assembly protein CpaB [Salinihabitans flavidus]|uniref:Pilus assembly protein CpaB n=1 Tax=Salinihabitans flavidus TaxID=569882 RepID=A0A1H8VV11_9RHOB|nr:Flp pilus assembly protein CpaB [Salinihabitans flavidus]SEP18758.1 pilus assembly protein CpaB [Salinihabitans flavidus]
MLRPLILLIALAAGGGAAWIAAQRTAPEPVTEAPTPVATEMTAVLVAAQDVPRGSQATADAFSWQQWPADAVPTTFIERSARPDAIKEFAGQFASRAISIGEPIANHLLTQAPGGFLAAMLSPGKRAVGIHASTQSTAGGFILPNDRVDVLHTTEGSRGREGGESRSRTILRGVRVLAIDQTTNDTESGTVLGKTATLELTEAQAEAVTAAQATGTLSLSLRPMDETPGETSMEVVEPPKTIRIHRGTSIEDVVIN